MKYHYVISLFLIFGCLISCQNDSTIHYTQKQIDELIFKAQSNVSESFTSYIMDNLALERRIESNSTKLKEDLVNITSADTLLLLLICSNMDCITCVDRQFSELSKRFSVDEFKEKVVLLTNQDNLVLLEERWPKIVRILNKVILNDVALLESRYGYRPLEPMYILFNRSSISSSGAYRIDLDFSQLDGYYLDDVKEYLKDN